MEIPPVSKVMPFAHQHHRHIFASTTVAQFDKAQGCSVPWATAMKAPMPSAGHFAGPCTLH